jgi:hypothetical protein
MSFSPVADYRGEAMSGALGNEKGGPCEAAFPDLLNA